MLQINGKTFMNLQEAVQWLLDNNALPFQSSANYVANTEIGMGTIVNPSPAKVRIGSLIFFADSKVSTVIGLTENGFICSDQYNNLVDDIAYVTNVAINASGHLITTLSDGQTIDAGIVKQVSGFSINGSQHLIVSFNDGTTNDLGAIFSGNVNISGNLTADSIIENMSGYTYVPETTTNLTTTPIYMGVCKNGNKITFVAFMRLNRTGTVPDGYFYPATFRIPEAVGQKLFPYSLSGVGGNTLCSKSIDAYKSATGKATLGCHIGKNSNTQIYMVAYGINDLDLNTDYVFRFEATFLLSENLAS